MQNRRQFFTVPGISSIFWVAYSTSLDDRLEKNKLRSNLLSPLWSKIAVRIRLHSFHMRKEHIKTSWSFWLHWAFFRATVVCHQQIQQRPELCAYSMSCGCSSVLREDVTQQHSCFPGCSRKWGGTELDFFPQPIFLLSFPLHLSFLLYGLILLNISPMPIKLAAASQWLLWSCSLLLAGLFSLKWTSVCNLILDYWPYLRGNGRQLGLWYQATPLESCQWMSFSIFIGVPLFLLPSSHSSILTLSVPHVSSDHVFLFLPTVCSLIVNP